MLSDKVYFSASLGGAGKANSPADGGKAREKCLLNSSQLSEIRKSVVTDVICFSK